MSLAHDLYLISKPRIMLLLLVVAWASMVVAAGGWPPLVPFAAVTVAGVASTAASGALNHVLERDRDRKMGRTADRPLASGRLRVPIATAYAFVMATVGVVALWLPGYTLAAFLVLGAMTFYVAGYTVLLKPHTAQNIVIGGLAGGFPALIGWAAVTGTIGWAAWAIALVVFAWTPPHFWALALLYKDDYAAADYPMMPTVRGDASTKRQMVFYAGLTVLASLALVPLGAGVLYLGAAVGLGALFVGRAVALLDTDERPRYRAYFFFTIQYLGALLVALMADVALVASVPGARPF
jgi:protoheme IX farnesyltransferase